MIVDDDAGTRKMIRAVLDMSGITFCECASGDEAVLRAREFRPDWVTMDVHMPGRNGFKSTEALCAEHPSAQVIIVTAADEPYYQQLATTVGAVGLIYKKNLAPLRMRLIKELCDFKPTPSVSESSPPDTI
jgi:DNA-binding NarL/FixJ family response regulator